MQNKTFITNKTLNLGGRLLDLTEPKVMGILNATPDSFYAGSRATTEKEVLTRAGQMLKEGATWLDIGGYSTRPGAPEVPENEEHQRIIPLIQAICREFPSALVSVDTFRSTIARAALEAGAVMINDISGGTLDKNMHAVAAEAGVPYVLMHTRGTPQTMSTLTNYNNLVRQLMDYFHQKLLELRQAGVNDIVIDPGFGFAKTVEQNFQLLNHLPHLRALGAPILVGVSRKSMIWKTLQLSAEQALNGTTSLDTVALLKGADILRVHDVQPALEAIRLISAMRQES